MKINKAMQNVFNTPLLGSPGHADVTLTPTYLPIYLRSGEFPTDLKLETEWTRYLTSTLPVSSQVGAMVANLPGATMLYTAGTFTASANPNNDSGIILSLSGLTEYKLAASGTLSYIVIGMSSNSTIGQSFFILSVGLIGSGADVELTNTDLTIGESFKFNDIEIAIPYVGELI